MASEPSESSDGVPKKWSLLERFRDFYLEFASSAPQDLASSDGLATVLARICETALRVSHLPPYGDDPERLFLFALHTFLDVPLLCLREIEPKSRSWTTSGPSPSGGTEYDAVAATIVKHYEVERIKNEDPVWLGCEMGPLRENYASTLEALKTVKKDGVEEVESLSAEERSTLDNEIRSRILSKASLLDRRLLDITHVSCISFKIPTGRQTSQRLLLEIYCSSNAPKSNEALRFLGLEPSDTMADPPGKGKDPARANRLRCFLAAFLAELREHQFHASKAHLTQFASTRLDLPAAKKRLLARRPESVDALLSELITQFTALETFSRFFRNEITSVLARWGWIESIDRALLPCWESVDGSFLSLAITVGDRDKNAPESRHSYWFQKNEVRKMARAWETDNERGTQAFLDFWAADYAEGQSFVGYATRTRYPLYAEYVSDDLRFHSYSPILADRERSAFANFEFVLQIPLLTADFGQPSSLGSKDVSSGIAGISEDEGSTVFIALNAVFLASAPIEPELRIELWEAVRRSRPAAWSAWEMEGEIRKLRDRVTSQAYEEQVRAWAHEAGQVSSLLGSRWMVPPKVAASMLRNATSGSRKRLKQEVLVVPYGEVFAATRDYIWLWAPPKGETFSLIEMVKGAADVEDFLGRTLTFAKNCIKAYDFRLANPDDPDDVLERLSRLQLQYFDRIRIVNVLPASVKLAPDLRKRQDESPNSDGLFLLARAICAAVLNAFKHSQPTSELGLVVGAWPDASWDKLGWRLKEPSPKGMGICVVNPLPKARIGEREVRQRLDGTEQAITVILDRLSAFVPRPTVWMRPGTDAATSAPVFVTAIEFKATNKPFLY